MVEATRLSPRSFGTQDASAKPKKRAFPKTSAPDFLLRLLAFSNEESKPKLKERLKLQLLA